MRSINRGWANRVRVARDGVEALDMLLGRDGVEQVLEPRLVLLDLKLPKMDGIAVPRQIRSNPKTRLVPAVMLTSSVQERDIIESYELGVNSYIVKPVDFEQFIESVRQIGLYWLVLNQRPLGT